MIDPTPAFWIIAGIAGFALGSIPFALILGRTQGVDIRTVGSKNVGATNLGRALGLRWFFVCFVLDMLKGLIPTLGAGLLVGLVQGETTPSAGVVLWWLMVMLSPVLGHMFSPFVSFKGGKGVATGLGALLGVFPVLSIAGGMALVVFLLVFFLSRYVSLASCAAAASLPAWAFAALALRDADPGAAGWPYLLITGFIGALVVAKHGSNLRRLLAGNEPKIPRRQRT